MRPVRVMHVGWGMLPYWGGGMVSYQRALMVGLSRLGYDVVAVIASGRTGSRKSRVASGRPWGAVRVIELTNALDPRVVKFLSPKMHCTGSALSGMVLDCVARERPELVHLHDLRLYSADLIDAIAAMSIPIVKTTHNYWELCPQGDLSYKTRELCTGYRNGESCVRCLAALPYRSPGGVRRSKDRPHEWISALGWGFLERWRRRATLPPSSPYPAALHRADEYCLRREFLVERLNKLQALICPSHGCANLFVGAGIDPKIVHIICHSSESLDGIIPKPIRGSELPVTFAYCGGASSQKGFDILAKAFMQLDQARARLVLYDCNHHDISHQLRRLNVWVRPRYDPDPAAINRAFSDIDVGVVPSQCYEVFGLVGVEFLQARVPVIGSDIGGIPEWLTHGVNGLLVPPGDVNALACAMEAFVADPTLVERLQKGIRPWKSFHEHCAEVAQLYCELLGLPSVRS